MKYALLGLTTLLAQDVIAFPAQVAEEIIRRVQNGKENWVKERAAAISCPFAKREAEAEAEPDAEPGCPFAKSKRQAPGITPPFDEKLQYVSTSGDHKFVAPGPNDLRGPCPGLNALSNHGYLPHNGVGSIQDFITGTAAGFGMGADLSSFLAVYGSVFDGDLVSYSIGGPPPKSLLSGIGLVGQPQGLSGSHNKYEGDVSPTRGDLYQKKNSYLLQMDQFKALYEMGQQNGDSVDLGVLTAYRHQRYQESLSQNPYFYNAPFSGVLAQPAAWSFIYRFMANKSAEHPMGLLDGETLKSFYAISGTYPDLTYQPGHEKFPENWYKRHPLDDYTIPYLELDTIAMATVHPEFIAIGGNTGTPNSFVGIQPEDLTGGVFNGATLLEGNNLFCYALQTTLQQTPDFLSGIFTDVAPAQNKITGAITEVTNSLGCPELSRINKEQFEQFPGYKNLKADGSY